LSTPHRTRGIKILKAVSSPLRLQILNLLYDKGPLTYTELMNNLKMNPTRDAGRFAYHLKFLLHADLIETIVEAKKYALTDLGKAVIDVADDIEKKAHRPKNILIRASRSAIEEFDPNKIANTLTREAKMPPELAQKVAKEAETQLLKSKTKYLTAPLVRELVNAILIEKGLEEYRHKLTRLGIPVHDVTSLLHAKPESPPQRANSLEAAGQTVFKEYTLLNALPRDIADAHLSGALHLHNLTTWILKPTEMSHDARYFLQNGLNLEKISPTQPSTPPPNNLEAALTTIFNVLLHAAREIESTQILDYFNIFIAPFTRGLETSRTKEALRQFITNLAQHVDATVGLETTIPEFMAKKPAIGPNGKQTGEYQDFLEESQNTASLLLDVLIEETDPKPLLNPKLIVKVRPEIFKDQRAKALLLKAHALAARNGTPYFANFTLKDGTQTVYSSSACKFGTEPGGDWEINTLRTGCLGIVTVNLPRAAIESGNDKSKFLEVLRERLEMANRALEIKHQNLRQYGFDQLPFVTQGTNGDRYLRLENSTHVINLAGLREALETLSGTNPTEEHTALLTREIINSLTAFTHRGGKRHGRRVNFAALPSRQDAERLAQLDIERYGIGKTRHSGARDKPYYSTSTKITLKNGQIFKEPLTAQDMLGEMQAGGSLALIELEETEYTPDRLLEMTERLIADHKLEFFTYNRKTTYCTNCRRSWLGLTLKCPSCGSVSSLTYYNRADET
jgi:anaerobic ribonucleoside-triphosphate reductase